jgi:transglutaminase-like putative cysteine protease
VAGTENIQSFAPIEDAPFLSSHEPSLYDLFDDTYSEPVKVEKQERAIALPPQFAAKQKESHLAESRQAGKEFSTLRKQGEAKRQNMANLDSDALLYVKGRVPLHLKLEAFDRYDGIDWFPESLSEKVPKLEIETLSGKPWLRVSASRLLEIYSPPETHALKIIRLDTNRIPAPTQMLGIHIDKVDRSDFFEWAQPGVVRMDRDKLPPLSVIHVQSRIVDERLIPKTLVHLSGGPAVYRQFGTDEQSRRVRELAELWTKDVAVGWQQVQTIVERLRREYVHDHSAKPPSDCEHTVADFLFESRRGPDYQFASASVWMLRSLGYSTRLVSGFYADPVRYDMRDRHTAVTAKDIHFWAEVSAGSNNWLPIEPTPGYQSLQPPPTLVEQFLAAGMGAWQWFVANVIAIFVSAAVMIWLFVKRHFVADRISTAIWRWWPARSERAFVRQTLRLLDRRFHRMGFTRSAGTTPTRWLERMVSHECDSDRQVASRFKQLAEWADFGPADTMAPTQECRFICQKAVQIWTWKSVGRTTNSSRILLGNHRSAFKIHPLHQPIDWLRKIVE